MPEPFGATASTRPGASGFQLTYRFPTRSTATFVPTSYDVSLNRWDRYLTPAAVKLARKASEPTAATPSSIPDVDPAGAQMTICASNTSAATGGGPPIAVYGLKTALTGSFPVSAQTLCPPTDQTCALINTGNSPKTTLTIQGTTYAPRAFIVIILNNNTKKVFYWGLISYAISFTGLTTT